MKIESIDAVVSQTQCTLLFNGAPAEGFSLEEVGIEKGWSERLKCLFLYFLLRKKEGIEWVSLEDLYLSIGRDIQFSTFQKWMQDLIATYENEKQQKFYFETYEEYPENYIIHYKNRTVSQNRLLVGGKSRGPYRLHISVHKIDLKYDELQSFLDLSVSRRDEILPSSSHFVGDFFAKTEDLLKEENYSEARVYAIQSLEKSFKEEILLSDEEKAYLWKWLANAEMQLGLSSPSLCASEQALLLFKKLKKHSEIADMLQLSSHALSQLGRAEEALKKMELALHTWRKTHKYNQKIFKKSMFYGVYGQRLSGGNRFDEAETYLSDAREMALSEGHKTWALVWSLRLAEMKRKKNALSQKDIDFILCEQEQLFPILRIDQKALLFRVMACSFDSLKMQKECWCWYQAAREIGIQHHMKNQLRRIQHLSSMFADTLIFEKDSADVLL